MHFSMSYTFPFESIFYCDVATKLLSECRSDKTKISFQFATSEVCVLDILMFITIYLHTEWPSLFLLPCYCDWHLDIQD